MPKCGRKHDLCPALVMSRKLTTGTKGEALCRIEHLRDGWEQLRMESKVRRTRDAAKYLAVSPWKLTKLVHDGRVAYFGCHIQPRQRRELAGLDAWQNNCRGRFSWPS